MSLARPLAASGRAMRLEILRRQPGQALRSISNSSKAATWTATAPRAAAPSPASSDPNPPLSFPCLDATEQLTARLASRTQQVRQTASSTSGPEPSYTSGYTETFTSNEPLLLDWGGVLPSFTVAYETWGTLNADKSNAILLHTGLSASSHAHSTERNPKPGWWEKFIGPGAPLDTNKFFIICTNVLGGCYGSTGPSSLDPSFNPSTTSRSDRYATRFPILTMQDMVRAQFRLLDHLHISRLAASVGNSMGGMQSLAAGVLFPSRVAAVVSVSGCARSHPYSIAMRHTQRQVLMNDPAWSTSRGDYYRGVPPHAGMKLAREIATVTYRSGPEWEMRFGRRRADPSRPPALCPDFLIETYLDHAGEKWCLEYDANSLLYVSKAMDLFDLGREHMGVLERSRRDNGWKLERFGEAVQERQGELCNLTLPDTPYEEQDTEQRVNETPSPNAQSTTPPASAGSGRRPDLDTPPPDLVAGLSAMVDTPTLVMGVASDILFPAWQQREVALSLRAGGNTQVRHVELGEERSLFGHDTFLLDLEGVGGEIGRFLDEVKGR